MVSILISVGASRGRYADDCPTRTPAVRRVLAHFPEWARRRGRVERVAVLDLMSPVIAATGLRQLSWGDVAVKELLDAIRAEPREDEPRLDGGGRV